MSTQNAPAGSQKPDPERDDDPTRGLGVTYIKTDDVELAACRFCHKLVDVTAFACPRCGWKVGA